LLLISAVVPASKTLLAELHLVPVCFFTFLLDLCVVGVAFSTAGSALTNAGEQERREKESACRATSTVDGELGSLGKSGELLGNGEAGC
jgi:hypothetical protein